LKNIDLFQQHTKIAAIKLSINYFTHSTSTQHYFCLFSWKTNMQLNNKKNDAHSQLSTHHTLWHKA